MNDGSSPAMGPKKKSGWARLLSGTVTSLQSGTILVDAGLSGCLVVPYEKDVVSGQADSTESRFATGELVLCVVEKTELGVKTVVRFCKRSDLVFGRGRVNQINVEADNCTLVPDENAADGRIVRLDSVARLANDMGSLHIGETLEYSAFVDGTSGELCAMRLRYTPLVDNCMESLAACRTIFCGRVLGTDQLSVVKRGNLNLSFGDVVVCIVTPYTVVSIVPTSRIVAGVVIYASKVWECPQSSVNSNFLVQIKLRDIGLQSIVTDLQWILTHGDPVQVILDENGDVMHLVLLDLGADVANSTFGMSTPSFHRSSSSEPPLDQYVAPVTSAVAYPPPLFQSHMSGFLPRPQYLPHPLPLPQQPAQMMHGMSMVQLPYNSHQPFLPPVAALQQPMPFNTAGPGHYATPQMVYSSGGPAAPAYFVPHGQFVSGHPLAPSNAPTLAPSVVPPLAPTLAPSVVPPLAPTLAPSVVPLLAHAPCSSAATSSGIGADFNPPVAAASHYVQVAGSSANGHTITSGIGPEPCVGSGVGQEIPTAPKLMNSDAAVASSCSSYGTPSEIVFKQPANEVTHYSSGSLQHINVRYQPERIFRITDLESTQQGVADFEQCDLERDNAATDNTIPDDPTESVVFIQPVSNKSSDAAAQPESVESAFARCNVVKWQQFERTEGLVRTNATKCQLDVNEAADPKQPAPRPSSKTDWASAKTWTMPNSPNQDRFSAADNVEPNPVQIVDKQPDSVSSIGFGFTPTRSACKVDSNSSIVQLPPALDRSQVKHNENVVRSERDECATSACCSPVGFEINSPGCSSSAESPSAPVVLPRLAAQHERRTSHNRAGTSGTTGSRNVSTNHEDNASPVSSLAPANDQLPSRKFGPCGRGKMLGERKSRHGKPAGQSHTAPLRPHFEDDRISDCLMENCDSSEASIVGRNPSPAISTQHSLGFERSPFEDSQHSQVVNWIAVEVAKFVRNIPNAPFSKSTRVLTSVSKELGLSV